VTEHSCRFCGSPAIGFYIIGWCCASCTPRAQRTGVPEEPRAPRAQEPTETRADARPARAYGAEVRLGNRALTEPATRLWNVLQDGSWRTIADLARASDNEPETVTGWLKDFQTPLYGGQDLEKRRAPADQGGAWEVRLVR
jgi:hypothetical protein